jgi:hypothetical protein
MSAMELHNARTVKMKKVVLAVVPTWLILLLIMQKFCATMAVIFRGNTHALDCILNAQAFARHAIWNWLFNVQTTRPVSIEAKFVTVNLIARIRVMNKTALRFARIAMMNRSAVTHSKTVRMAEMN